MGQIVATIRGFELRFETHPSLFSPRKVDAGTLAMLSAVPFEAQDKVLDLGCGYGVVGIVAAKLTSPQCVFMLDNDPIAVEYASANVRLNGLGGVTTVLSEGFTEFSELNFSKMLCNPPYHTDFEVAKHFILKGFNRLALGGKLYMVTKRLTWYRNKMHSVFGRVAVHSAGTYYVLEATKQNASYAGAERTRRAR